MTNVDQLTAHSRFCFYPETTMTLSTQSVHRPVEGLAVTGEATRNTAAEMVEVCFEVLGAGPSAPVALQDNLMRCVQVTQALTNSGIAQGDIQAGTPMIRPILQP